MPVTRDLVTEMGTRRGDIDDRLRASMRSGEIGGFEEDEAVVTGDGIADEG